MNSPEFKPEQQQQPAEFDLAQAAEFVRGKSEGSIASDLSLGGLTRIADDRYLDSHQGRALNEGPPHDLCSSEDEQSTPSKPDDSASTTQVETKDLTQSPPKLNTYLTPGERRKLAEKKAKSVGMKEVLKSSIDEDIQNILNIFAENDMVGLDHIELVSPANRIARDNDKDKIAMYPSLVTHVQYSSKLGIAYPPLRTKFKNKFVQKQRGLSKVEEVRAGLPVPTTHNADLRVNSIQSNKIKDNRFILIDINGTVYTRFEKVPNSENTYAALLSEGHHFAEVDEKSKKSILSNNQKQLILQILEQRATETGLDNS